MRCIYVKKKNLYLLFHQGVLCQGVLCQVALCQVALYRLYHREVLYLVALNGVS